MKIQTIHKNVCGEVLNPVSAVGIRITTDDGEVFEVRAAGNSVEVHCPRGSAYSGVNGTVKFWLPWGITGMEATGVVVDEVHGGRHYCYECGKPAKWLAPDSRCGNCTQVTVDEVCGHDPD